MSSYKCEHEKYKCKPCGIGYCEHGKIQYNCIDCGGKGICEHKKRKSICRECCPTRFCEHNKDKYSCGECHGSQICKHDKFKQLCKECGGSAFCKHEKIKSQCKECGGSALCEHNIQKYTCRECCPTSFCEHGKCKRRCRKCGGSQICEHNKIKSACKECGGSQICEHNKFKRTCKECGGSAFCEHGKYKSGCKECGGTQICKHQKQKSQCKECGGTALCKSIWCEKYGIKKYNGYCLICCVNLFPEIEVSRNYKTKENNVVTHITTEFPQFTWISDKKIQDGCSRRRPDLLLDLGTQIIIIEVDENKHSNYDCSCENKRLMEISQDVGHRPIIFIRFNPDSYIDSNGNKISSCWKISSKGLMIISKNKTFEWDKRIETLKEQIKYWISNTTNKTIEIIELFY